MIQISYDIARESMKPGDVIAFGGEGFVSNLIKDATNSPVSHVGVIMQTDLSDSVFVNQIIESNGKKKGLTGVQVWRMSERLEEYEGSVWWLPMAVEFDKQEFVGFCLSQKGKKYDAPQAIGSAIDFVPDQIENLDRLFCSELVFAALESAGVIPPGNASEATPADIVNLGIYGDVCQLKGVIQEIT